MNFITQKSNINLKKVISYSEENIVKLVNDSERRLKKQLNDLTNHILKESDDIDMILLAGPSCSGKTTFSQMLADKLQENGVTTTIISLDNFFVDRDKTPFLEDGVTRDYESLKCFDFKQIRDCFTGLKEKGEQKFPIFDFINGKNLPDSLTLTWKRPQKIIFEGLHTHNPELIENLGFNKLFKLYVCANSDFVMDKKTVITSDQLRYMRRITRDRVSRGHTPLSTFNTWPHVLAGEEQYINQFKYTADYLIDTVHPYELCLYKFYVGAILGSMKYSGESLYLNFVLKDIKGYNKSIIPDFSLMWEFIKV